MCWNNSGNYDLTPLDVTPNEEYTGTTAEADKKYRKPAIGNETKPLHVDSDVSILDSILNPTREDDSVSFKPFLRVLP